MALAIEHFRPQHRLLHFGAILLWLVLPDHAQRPRIHVDFHCGMRARVRRTAVNRCAHFVLVPQPREYARLSHVDH